jgi:hypothetical protein
MEKKENNPWISSALPIFHWKEALDSSKDFSQVRGKYEFDRTSW